MGLGPCRSRLGIGNVIASVIFIFIFLFSMSALYLYNLELTDEYNRVAGDAFLADIQRAGERISISSVDYEPSNGLLDLTVANTGGENLRMVALWIAREGVVGPHTRIPLNVALDAGRSRTIQDIATGMSGSQIFTARLVTERGASVGMKLIPASGIRLSQTLVIAPPTLITGNNVEVLLSVSNNQSDSAYRITPRIELKEGTTVLTNSAGACVTSAAVTCTLVLAPQDVSFLGAGNSATFKWIYTLSSTIPDKVVNFRASYTTLGAISDVTASATIRQTGGASGADVGAITRTTGSLIIDITSFQPTRDASCWKASFQIKGGGGVVFRVKISNIGSNNITLAKESVFVTTDGAGVTSFYIGSGATIQGNLLKIDAISASGLRIDTGKTVAVYFGASAPATGTSNAVNMPAAGKRLFTFVVILGTYTQSGNSFGQSIPFVGLETIQNEPQATCQPTSPY